MLTREELRTVTKAIEHGQDAIALLVEFVAWEGSEDHFATCQRLERAEKLVKRAAPDLLKAERVKVKAVNGE